MGQPLSRLTLSEAEKASPLWVKIRDHYRAKLYAARRKNDGLMADASRFPLLVEIKAARDILDLENDPPTLAAS